MKASKLFKEKDVNYVYQEWMPDGSVKVTVIKSGWKKKCTFVARKIYEKDEEIILDEEVEVESE